jgi:hypothetical protein
VTGRPGLSDTNKFLVEGSLQDIILLYNISSTAPHVWRNVRGDVVFQNDTAMMCFAQPTPDVLMERFAEHLLRDQGIRSLSMTSSPCDLSAAAKSVDVFAFRRGDLLKQKDEYLLELAKNVENNAFREYQIITDYPGVLAKRQALSLQIEEDVEKGTRDGYGAIAVNDSPVACIITSGSSDVTAGLKELMNRNRDIVAPRQASDLQFIERSVDLSFLDLQRSQCGYVAGSAADLKSIRIALRREPQLRYSFAPAWWNSNDVNQAAFDVDSKTREEIKKKELLLQAQKDQHALDDERAKNHQAVKTEIENTLRAKNGVRARGLMNQIRDFVSDLAEKRRTDTDRVYPDFSHLLNLQFDEGWETYGLNFEVADYGTLTWQKRDLNGIIVKAIIQQKNRVLGRYDNQCFMFGLVDDVEFQMERDQFGVPCSNTSFVNSWKIGKDFHSGWNAD